MGSKVIIDVDTGVDDAQALMMAASQDDVDILAVTCVTGNVHVDQVITNTLRVLRVCDRLDVSNSSFEGWGVRELPSLTPSEKFPDKA